MIKALVFDFDGLVLDTETPELQSWQEVYAEHGCALPLDHWLGRIGKWSDSEFDPYHYLESLLGRPLDREALRAWRRPRNAALVEAQSILPGVEACIADGRARGLRLGVASNSPHAWVDVHLKRLGLWTLFDSVRCRDDVETGKPDPAVYRAALADLGVGPDEAIAFEDSSTGMAAARRAGLFCVVVPSPLTRGLEFDHPDLMLTSLADRSLESLLVEAVQHVSGEAATAANPEA